jgi:hypothetical protein
MYTYTFNSALLPCSIPKQKKRLTTGSLLVVAIAAGGLGGVLIHPRE